MKEESIVEALRMLQPEGKIIHYSCFGNAFGSEENAKQVYEELELAGYISRYGTIYLPSGDTTPIGVLSEKGKHLLETVVTQ